MKLVRVNGILTTGEEVIVISTANIEYIKAEPRGNSIFIKDGEGDTNELLVNEKGVQSAIEACNELAETKLISISGKDGLRKYVKCSSVSSIEADNGELYLITVDGYYVPVNENEIDYIVSQANSNLYAN